MDSSIVSGLILNFTGGDGCATFNTGHVQKNCSLPFSSRVLRGRARGKTPTRSSAQAPPDRVDADLRGMALWPLLEKIASDADLADLCRTGHHPHDFRKIQDLPSGDALKMLLGIILNFALVPRTNGRAATLCFSHRDEKRHAAVLAPKATPKHVPNELLVKLKPGTDVDALAKLLGAKITGRNDKLGLYRLLFKTLPPRTRRSDSCRATPTFSQWTTIMSSTHRRRFRRSRPHRSRRCPLQLNPPGDSGKVIVRLIDMNVQSLGAQLDKFVLPQLDVAGDVSASSDITHGTAMAYNILTAIAQASSGSSSVQNPAGGCLWRKRIHHLVVCRAGHSSGR